MKLQYGPVSVDVLTVNLSLTGQKLSLSCGGGVPREAWSKSDLEAQLSHAGHRLGLSADTVSVSLAPGIAKPQSVVAPGDDPDTWAVQFEVECEV